MADWICLLSIVAAVFSVFWALATLLGVRGILRTRELRPGDGGALEPWPKLSVIIPALNEAETIEPALRSVLASDYPNLEVIAVDDRSTDATGAILDRLAAEDPRLRAIHIQTLPPGWLGKVHALHQGQRAASGEWLLLTDADVHFRRGALSSAVAVAEREGLDHLTAMPMVKAHSLPLRAVLVSFAVTISFMAKPHRIGLPGSKAFGGIGAFNLLRASRFRETAGFPWLKLEVADDMAIGKLMVEAGARSRWYRALELMEIEWYPTLSSLVRGLEKNSYGIFSFFRVWVLLTKMAIYLPILSSPFVALASGVAWIQACGALALLAVVGAAAFVSTKSHFGPLPGLLAPVLGSAVLLVTLFRSAIACWRAGGIRWRGTLYKAAELREGQRIKLW
ncbi:MAG: glycosyltransferase family 2 protein [Myxococcota bacterium]